ncbi:unnamed protein product [Orchesella dallaii]|uniref:Apolipophorin n=1 Tax=Orchesella dallaii TaxID=48710 RepID=A0ABP1QW60_9HEXA
MTKYTDTKYIEVGPSQKTILLVFPYFFKGERRMEAKNMRREHVHLLLTTCSLLITMMISTLFQSAFSCIDNVSMLFTGGTRRERRRRRKIVATTTTTSKISCNYQRTSSSTSNVHVPSIDDGGQGSGEGRSCNAQLNFGNLRSSGCSGASRSLAHVDTVLRGGNAQILRRCDHVESENRRWSISNGFLGGSQRRMRGISLSHSIVTFCLIILPTFSLANPTRNPGTCGPMQCKAGEMAEGVSDFKFQYKPYSFYNYLYVVNSTIAVNDGPSEASGLHFSANTTMQFLTACDAILHMTDVELWQSVLPSGQDDNPKHHLTRARTRESFKNSLEQFPLRFSFADGLIEEICPEKEEAAWVLNIKRGFLSAFQNTMKRLDLELESYENDVNGKCKVEYRLGEATSSTLTIERVKDFSSCGDKHGIFSTIQGSPYTFGKLEQSMPIVESVSECSQVVDRNLIVEVQCQEQHQLKPVSTGVSGVHVSIAQHLDLIVVYNGVGNMTGDGQVGSNGAGGYGAADDDDDDVFGLDDDFGDEDEENDGNKGKEEAEQDFENGGTFLILRKADPYITEIISRSPGQISRREFLSFHHEYHVGSTANDLNTATNALVKFCQAVKLNVDRNSGALFDSLVEILRGLDARDMIHLSREASTLCEGDRSPFDNILEAVGTAASVGVIKERIFSGYAPRETISSWINSLAFIPKPDLDLMTAAFQILRVRDNYPNILLSYSSLAHSFCRQQQASLSSTGVASCDQHQPVQILTRLYEKFFNLTGCVTKQRKNVEQVLMYLKGIGNFGLRTEELHNALQTCISVNNNAEIRVAAVEAYRRMPCSEMNGYPELRKLFENEEEDAELRIASFLAIMRCPTYPTIRWLKKVMAKEQMRQVTSFVSSYIRNLQETSLPSKLELQGLVADEKLNDPFSTDFRQFSKNFEASAFHPDWNLGMGLDSNLIFSQLSYMPRSTSLNLTLDLFGESINVFEATVRLESFEHYVESIFGPNGKLSGTGIHKMLSSLHREKRAVPSKRKMRTLALEYDAMKRYNADPIVSLSLKTLGNEVAFLRKVGLDEQVESLNELNPFQFLEKLSNTKDSNWQKSAMLFDSSYIIPTGVGLPLNLSAQASSIMRFQAESMIDATNFRANPFQLKLKGKLVPSALLTATAGVTLSAFEAHAGMKVRAHLRSSTALEGSFEVQGAQLVDVEFGVPKTQLELLEFKSDVLFMQGDEFHASDESPKLTQACNTGLLYKYLGLKLCKTSQDALPKSGTSTTSSSSPYQMQTGALDDTEDEDHPPTLLSDASSLIKGPSYFAVTLDKANPHLLKTRFHYQWNNNETNTDFKLRTIRTTGSNSELTPRQNELGINYVFNKEDSQFNLEVNFPGSTATANGQIKKEQSVVKLDVTDTTSGSPFMGLSLSLDSVTFTGNGEDQERETGSGSSRTFSGTGDVYYKEQSMELQIQGSQNSSRLTLDCKGSYRRTGGGRQSPPELITLQLSASNQEQRRHGQLLETSTDTEVLVGFSQFPDYNTILSWKSKISEDGYENNIDFRQGRNYLTQSDPTTFRIAATVSHESNHERAGIHWMFLATQPSTQTDWGVEAVVSSHGKSFDSAISFRYAPGKSYETTISLKRKPGVMILMDFAMSLKIPQSSPFLLSFHLEEKAPRIYQAHYKLDWFGSNGLDLDVELSERSRRNKVDTACTIIISTKSIDNLKMGFHYLSEEKETKLQLNSEYQNKRNAFEAGHIGRGGNKHKLYVSVTTEEVVYLVMSELDLEHGIHCSFKTDFGPGFSDILIRVKLANQNGLRQLNLEYGWDATRDRSKQFLFEVYHDTSRPSSHRFEVVVSYPDYNYFFEAQYRYNEDDGSRVVTGRLKWKDEEHLHVNAQLVPRISDHEAYDVLLEVATPFELVKNVSFNAGIQLLNGRKQWQVDMRGSWGDDQTLSAVVETNLQQLDIDGETSTGLSNPSRYRFRLDGNFSSTLDGLEALRVNLDHSKFTSINFKTDLDIQLPNEREISVTSHLVLPESFSDLLSTRVELHIKTPFVGYQNIDLQAILGRKEDKDVMALIGIYIENFQYSVSITGTPRFEEDGALGFEMTTSNPKYDKIFGSFSYVIGDNSRLACQLGWPQVVVGLEAGVESLAWEEFQIYLTFSSPWMPVKNINTLVKIDRAQFAEIKLELNEDGISAKSEWVIESWTSFDIRLDGSTPFDGAKSFGGLLKQSWDDPQTFYSQISGWIDEQQAGYKLEGGTSEKEEECGFSTVRQATLELDTVVYPTVRTTLNLAQMDVKYNLDASILLREGPINVIAELEILDVLRFNERVLITTPYPGLFELEINLNPAIVVDRDLYNLGLHSKWRSGSTWEEGGLVIRVGPQEKYAVLVTEDMENKAFLELCSEGEEHENAEAGEEVNEGDDYYSTPNQVTERSGGVDVPRSQLLHFYSPLKWANVVKLEYQVVSESPDIDVDGESQTLYQDSQDGAQLVDQFPLQNFALVYRGANASLSTILQNTARERTFTASIDSPLWADRVAMELDCSLDLKEVEKKLSIQAKSRYPTEQEYSLLSSWNNQMPQILSGRVEITTPMEKFEQQSVDLMYAHNEGENSYTVDVELMSMTFDKLATNFVLRPNHFSMTLNTPADNFQEMEIRADTTSNEEFENVFNSLITIKSGEREIEIDVDSEMDNGWPTKINGTVSATFGPSPYRLGNLKGNVERKDDDVVNANGEIMWQNGDELKALLYFHQPGEQLEQLTVKVDTNIRGLEQWQLEVNRKSGKNDAEIVYTAMGRTPYASLATLDGELRLEKVETWLHVRTLALTGQAPNSSFSVAGSWLLENWNNFEINTNATYNFEEATTLRQVDMLHSLPGTNSVSFILRNKIPTFSTLTTIDSEALIVFQQPYFRGGQSLFINLQPDESFTFKSSTRSMNESADITINSKFEEAFAEFDGTADYVHQSQTQGQSGGEIDRVYRLSSNWKNSEESFDGEAAVGWGSMRLGTTWINSKFNCSVDDTSQSTLLHVRVGSPVTKLSDSESSEQEPDGGATATALFNPLDSPMLTIDGSFNKISGRHSARVQFGQDDLDEQPLLTEALLQFQGFNEFDALANFSSGIDNFTSVGLRIGNRIEGNIYNGVYGGHWEKDEAMLEYSVEYANVEEMFLLNTSIYSVIPVSTESVPRPQRAAVDVFYKSEALLTESGLRGEYNGVQLFKTQYKSDSVSSAGLEQESTQLEFDNHFWPFGLNHTSQFEYNVGLDGSNLPTKLTHFVELYSLANATHHRIEGEMEIATNFTGKRLAIHGTHPSRKVHFITDYNLQERQLGHTTNFRWNEESWLGYKLAVMNKTQDGATDHGLSLAVTYPLRILHLDSGYTFNGNELKWKTELNLNGSKSEDKVVAEVALSAEPRNKNDTIVGKAVATVKHPALAHDMIAAGELAMVGLTASSSSPGRGRIDGIFSLEYSDDPTERLILNWDAKLDFHEIVYGRRRESGSSYTSSRLPYWELSTNSRLYHLATNLDLKALYSTHHSPHELSIITLIDFKNSVKNANQESKISFELLKESKKASIQMSDPEGYALFSGQLTGQYPHFVVNGESNVTGIMPSPQANFSVDFGKPYFTLYTVHGKDLTDGVFAKGGVVDSRNAIFDVSESYDNFRFSDVNFYLRLNHSRLITSKLNWRPQLFSEIKDLCVKVYQNATAFAGAKCDKLWQAVLEDTSQSAKDVWLNLKPTVEPLILTIKEDLNFTMDIEALKMYLIEMYENNELYLQDIHDFVQLVAEEIVARIKASIERYRRELASPAQLLKRAMKWIVEKFNEIYEHLSAAWTSYLNSGGEGFGAILGKLRQLFFVYFNDALQLAEELFYQVYQSLSSFASKVYAHFGRIVERYRPIILAHLHELEASVYNVVMRVLDFFYETKEAVMQSPYFQKLQQLAEDLDELYRDIRENDLETNFNKYFGMLTNFISRKLGELSQLKLSLGKLGERVDMILNEMVETEVIHDFKEGFMTAIEQVKGLIRYTEIDVLIPKVVLTLISKGKSIFFMTAIETASTFQQAKTKFIFDSSKGIISLEQKLPMSLAAFNETPNFRELPEYQVVLKAQEMFQSSEGSLWNVYHRANTKGNVLSLIPPFEGHAMLVGSHYFFTFDGLIYNHEGRCVHLLAADLVEGNFSVSLQYESKSEASDGGMKTPSPYYIVVASGHNTLIIDLKENGLKDPKRSLKQTQSLPIQMANLRGYWDSDFLVVESPKGLKVSCNTLYRICQVSVSGWYSRKIGGVLGTMDMEPVTDLSMANAKYTANLSQFFNSWDVSDDTTEPCNESSSSGMVDKTVDSTSPLPMFCQKLFQSKHSSLQPCFSVIDVDPYIDVCLAVGEETPRSPSTTSVCASAIAYASQCRGRGVWVKIPSSCIRCDMNGEAMMDRDMKVISSPPPGSPTSLSTDVVFIVEAKDCNRALRTRRKLDTVVAALEEEFVKKRFKDNRYAAVVFGGDGVFEQPRPIFQNGEVFTTSEHVGGFVTSIVIGKGNNDTFQAIWYALHKLKFRPGVSKTFILLPCSSCNPREMTVDYSTVHYAMLEQDVKLHVLMNNEFTFDSKNLAKKFFGYDSSLGYTKSDGVKGRLRGDSSIHPQIFLPRRTLGYCAPLALETNGTIFAGKKLQNRREKIVTLFTTVFSRRVVQTATPADCQTCYCLPDEEIGTGKVECFVCGYPRYKPLPDGYDDNIIDTDSDTKQVVTADEEEDAYEDVVDGEDESER